LNEMLSYSSAKLERLRRTAICTKLTLALPVSSYANMLHYFLA